MEQKMQAGVFKAKCLKIMDEVKKSKNSVVITKHKMPIIKIVPIEEEQTLFGKMKGTLHIKADIIQPIDEIWDANS